ncbi:glycosyltransferase [Lonepinella sp. BR2357]|uniref:glycosyltransferase n=1 Tax=Lonepinella sp. BR2357 TaxID=3434549 RepID=UPI003F6DEF02
MLWQPEYYFNAGVLFFNSDLWHLDEHILLKTTFDNPQFKHGDQDVLNLLIGDQYFSLDQGYNYQQAYAFPDIIQFTQGKKTQFSFPKIIHYTDNLKPWNKPNHAGLIYNFKNALLNNYQTRYLYFSNIHDFYASLPWNEIVDMPLNYFQSIVKQLYKMNFDYAIQGNAEIELVN